VLLGVNMQTSFMHPPFGFALFYLRSVAPTKEYPDRVTRKMIAPVTTMQIYWGAVPFVLIQIIMVGLIIAFPGIVSSGLDKTVKVDLDKVQRQMNRDLAAPPASGLDIPPAAETPAEAAKTEAEEQKELDQLFGTPKKK
jgi:hypothetical protein